MVRSLSGSFGSVLKRSPALQYGLGCRQVSGLVLRDLPSDDLALPRAFETQVRYGLSDCSLCLGTPWFYSTAVHKPFTAFQSPPAPPSWGLRRRRNRQLRSLGVIQGRVRAAATVAIPPATSPSRRARRERDRRRPTGQIHRGEVLSHPKKEWGSAWAGIARTGIAANLISLLWNALAMARLISVFTRLRLLNSRMS